MQIKDAEIVEIIAELSDHYRSNIASPYMRPLLLRVNLEKWVWDSISTFLEHVEHFHYQGYGLEELYPQVIALSHFIDTMRRQLIPNLKTWANTVNSTNKLLVTMSVNTFPSNLNILAEHTQRLYGKLIDIDNFNAKKSPPVYLQFPDLANIGRLLQTK